MTIDSNCCSRLFGLLFGFLICAESRVQELSILRQLFDATSGKDWVLKEADNAWEFSAAANPCLWAGVVCGNSPKLNESYIIGLDLESFGLVGKVPSILGYLTSLTHLNLKGNSLVAELPSELSQLTNMEYLRLSRNELTGTLPDWLSGFRSLSFLSLLGNNFRGSLPSSLGALTKLQIVMLDDNYLTGTIPSTLGLLSQCDTLSISSNLLTGAIPESFWANTALTSFDFSGNKLTSSLSPSIEKLVLLEQISIFDNSLTGSLPTSLGGLTSLTGLYLNGNSLVGSLPSELGLLTALQVINLNGNRLVGSMPTGLGLLTGLEVFYAKGNIIAGSLPSELGLMTALQYLDLSENRLSMSLPTGVGNLISLVELHLNANFLEGPLPESFWSFSQLTYLSLSSNKFSRTLSTSIGQLVILQQLYLDANNFSGTVPKELGSLTDLTLVNLSNNLLSGTLPPTLGGLNLVTYFNVEFNRIEGTIPGEAFSRMANLTFLFLDFNKFSSSIPRSLFTLKSLQCLALQNNKLTGSVHSNIGNLKNIINLNLANNKFTSTVPSALAQLEIVELILLAGNFFVGPLPDLPLRQLHTLNAYGNGFTGTLPSSLSLSPLTFLDLNSNKLRGPLPDWLSSVSTLKVLKLHNNEFTSIPAIWSQFHNLSVLELNNNKLTGTLTTLLDSQSLRSSLVILDTSSNSLSGSIPQSFSSCSTIKTLILAGNRLTNGAGGFGFLNAESMVDLQQLDLSNNLFVGSLPSDLFAFPNLKVLSLAVNCFKGQLPKNVCNATSLEVLVLDGLSSASPCPQSSLVGSVFSGMSGTLPMCLLSLPKMKTLHMSGNKLLGNLNDVHSVSPNLTNLALSHNQLIGAVPTSIQSQQLAALDLSHNKIGGTWSSQLLCEKITTYVDDDAVAAWDRKANEKTTLNRSTSVNLIVNRVSGPLPSSFQSADNISVLEGNLFSCLSKSELPRSDPYIDQFQCGSSAFDHYFYAFCVISVVAITVAAFFRRELSSEITRIKDAVAKSNELVKSAAEDDIHLLLHALYLVTAVFRLSMWAVPVCFFSMVVCGILTATSSSLMYSYAWATSLSFKSGTGAAASIVLIWTALLCLFHIVVTHVERVKSHRTKKGKKKHFQSNELALLTFRVFVLICLNIVIVVTMNIYYVKIILSTPVPLQIFTKISFSLIKVLWSFAFSFTKGRMSFGFEPESIHHFADKYYGGELTLDVLLQVFNDVITPFLSSGVVSSSCFKDLNVTPPKIKSSYSYTLYGQSSFTDANGLHIMSYKEVVSKTISFQPSWIYSYQCSSVLLVQYVPVFLLTAIFKSFFFPLKMLVYRLMNRERVLTKHSVDVVSFFCDVCSDLFLLATFGVGVPLLGLAIVLSILSRSFDYQRLISMQLENEQERQYVDLTKLRLFNLTRDHFSPVYQFRHLLVLISSVFFGFLSFDVAGDVSGFFAALWAPSLLVFFPIFISLAVEHWRRRARKKKRRSTAVMELPTLAGSSEQTVEHGNVYASSEIYPTIYHSDLRSSFSQPPSRRESGDFATASSAALNPVLIEQYRRSFPKVFAAQDQRLSLFIPMPENLQGRDDFLHRASM